MCNKISSRNPWTFRRDCGQIIDSLDRCGCDYRRSPSRKRVNWNSGKLVAAVAGVLLAASMFVSPAKAQEPQPTPSIGEPPHAIEMHRVYLPTVQFEAYVHGCDDCQAVNWNSGKVS